MKKSAAAIAAMSVVCLSGELAADSHEPAPLRWVPVEAWTCDYRDGKGAADLDAVITDWNAWMDASDEHEYFAITLTPFYFGDDAFDVGWLGTWPNGEAMGRGMDRWVTEGGELSAKFFQVLDCDSHSNFATAELKSPGEGPAPDNFVLTFSDCTGPESPEAWDQLFSGLADWFAYTTENGYLQGNWMMFPVYGGGGAEFDFKMVEGHDNHTQLGQDYQRYIDRRDWDKQGELIGSLMDCDDARVYQATVRRRAAGEE
jgi:hypothetical protein